MAEFDDLELLLALAAPAVYPPPDVKARLMARIRAPKVDSPATPQGFSFTIDADSEWQPHPVPGIRMKVLSVNRQQGYAALLLDVAPGARFPEHHHTAAEECYVISGTLQACGRTIGPGDFHHADANTDHGELYTETGCRVLLIVPPDGHLPDDTA